MEANQEHIPAANHLYCIGISYRTADEEVRGFFSLNESQTLDLLKAYQSEGIESVMVISTCNRTEVYGLVKHPFLLIKQFIKHSKGSMDLFEEVAYIYKNSEAISHLFRVSSGLDSQILGDFEIICQIKKSFNLSKKLQLINPLMERLYNSVIQAGKRVKTETEISSGAASVSFAAVQYILKHIEQPSDKNLLLFGTGKIGRNTCENLVKHIDNKHITLINRTEENAQRIAGKFQIVSKLYTELETELQRTDVLIVATGAKEPTIRKDMLPSDRKILILDLSIPKNVSDDVSDLPGVTLLHLDSLSKITDAAIEKRKAAIPQAEQIISEVKEEFDAWIETRRFAPIIQALKEKLNHLKESEIDFQSKKVQGLQVSHIDVFADRFIQKITTHFANHFKQNKDNPEESIEVIRKVFHLET